MIELSNGKLQVKIAERGAELMSVRDAEGKEYLWQGEPKFWSDRAPVLFPYVGRLCEGSYLLEGKEYKLDIHGFAKDSIFAVIEQSATIVEFELTESPVTLAQYPYRFCLKVRFELEDFSIKIRFSVDNRDERAMYFGIGGHPGLNVGTDGTDFTQWQLRFSEKCEPVRHLFSERYLINNLQEPYPLENGDTIPLEHNLFDDDAIVLEGTSRSVTLERKDGTGPKVQVDYPQMDFIGFWHAVKTTAPYVCVEPWGSLPSSEGGITVFEEKKDLTCLQAGERYVNDWALHIMK